MHKSEPRVNLTLKTYANKLYKLKVGPLGPVGVLASSQFNSEVDSTSYYNESTEPNILCK